MRAFGTVLAMLVFGWSMCAHAQGTPPEHTTYSFEDEQVFGGSVEPTGEVLRVRQTRASNSLVRARDNFVPELLESVESL